MFKEALCNYLSVENVSEVLIQADRHWAEHFKAQAIKFINNRGFHDIVAWQLLINLMAWALSCSAKCRSARIKTSLTFSTLRLLQRASSHMTFNLEEKLKIWINTKFLDNLFFSIFLLYFLCLCKLWHTMNFVPTKSSKASVLWNIFLFLGAKIGTNTKKHIFF